MVPANRPRHDNVLISRAMHSVDKRIHASKRERKNHRVLNASAAAAAATATATATATPADSSSTLSGSESTLGFASSSSVPVPSADLLPLGSALLDEARCVELQMQMLYVIGRMAERAAPLCYFNFDGVGASLRLKTLERFPSPKYGYTFCCWLKVNSFFDTDSSLLSWQSSDSRTMFELFFQLTPSPYDAQSRSLCVRASSASDLSSMGSEGNVTNATAAADACQSYAFDKYAFEENGQWHHLSFFHGFSSFGHVFFFRICIRRDAHWSDCNDTQSSNCSSHCPRQVMRIFSSVVPVHPFG
jgi:hypothetical protein